MKIGRFGEDNLLNSKGEFNRSHITRLTLGDKVDGKKETLVKATDEKDDGLEVPAATERKTTCGKVKEDDLEGKTGGKTGKEPEDEFERLQAGCWGEVGPRLVNVPGLQPYLPLPQRKVGRLRGKVAQLGQLLTKPGAFKSRDIREFLTKKTRAVPDARAPQEPNVSTQHTTFDDLSGRLGGRKRRRPAGGEDDVRSNKVVDGLMKVPDQHNEGPSSEGRG